MSDGTGWTPPVEPEGSGQWPRPWQPGDPGQPQGGAAPGWGAPPDQPGQPGQWGTPGQPGQPGQWGTPGQPPPGQPGWGGPPPQWGQQNAPWGAPSLKPGVIPLRPLAVGEVLDGAFTIMRHHPKVTLGLSALVISVSTLLQTAWEATVAFSPDAVDVDLTVFMSGFVFAFFISGIANTVLAGMLTHVAGEAVLGREATIGETWRKVRPRFWALLGAAILVPLLSFVGAIACILPGVFLWVAWAVVTPALILERVGVRTAMRRSWRLCVPAWWRMFGLTLLAGIVAGVLGSMISFPGEFLAVYVTESGGDAATALGLAISFLARAISGTITAPFTAGVTVLLYIDRRMRAEGLDVTLAQAAAAEAGRF